MDSHPPGDLRTGAGTARSGSAAEPRPRERSRAFHLVTAGGVVSAAFGALALVGWTFDFPLLADFGSRNIPMAPSTALLFVLFGTALAFAGRPTAGPGTRVAALLVASIGGAAAAALLLAGLQGVRSRVEHLGFAAQGSVDGAPIGHMSPVTACGFLLAALALALAVHSARARGWRARLAGVAGALLAGGGGLFVLAYLAGEPLFYGGTLIPPAATTSASFVALGVGSLALARYREGRRAGRARLRTRSEVALIGLSLALAAGIVLAGLSWLRGQGERFREQANRQISAIADLKAGEIVRWRDERLADGRVLQENEAFLRLARSVVDGATPAGGAGELEGWLDRIRLSYGYREIQVLAADGSPRLTVPRSGVSPCDEQKRRAPLVLRSGETALLDLHRDGPGGPAHTGVVVPLLADRSRAAVGAVVLSIDPNAALYPFVVHWPVPSPSGETLLVRRDGNDVLFLNELRFAKGSALSLRIPLSKREIPATWVAQGGERLGLGTDYRGVRVLAATRVVPGSRWGVVVKVDVAEAFGPFREQLWLTVLLMGGLVAAVGAAAGAVWRHELIRLEHEGRLAEAERAWLRDVIERSLNEVYVFDPVSLRFLFANRGAVRNLGYAEEELHRLTPLDIKPELTEESFREELRTVASQIGQVREFETTHRRKDGTEYPVEVHLQLVSTGLGDFFLAVINDITQRRRAEDRIRQLNRVLTVLSNVNQAIVRVRDPLALCREACRISVEEGGFLEAWIVLRDAGTGPLRVVAKEPAGPAGPEDEAYAASLTRMRELALEALRTGEPAISDLTAISGTPSAPDESRGAPETRAAVALPLVIEEAGAGALVLVANATAGFFDEEEMHLLVEMALDIGFALETSHRDDARREAVASLGRSEKRFRAVARLSADFSYSCVLWSDGAWIVDWITDAFFSISGYTGAELTEKGTWMFVVHPEDREAAEEPMGRLRIGEADSRELRIVTRDGSLRWLVNRMECEEDESAPGGRRILGAVQDVSLSKRAELEVRKLNAELETRVAERTSELAAANRELEAFAYSVAHDLKAPLRAIDGYSQVVLEEQGGALNEEGREHLGKLRRAAQRMAQLIEALLSYSRVERRTLQTETTDVAGVVGAALDELKDEVHAAGAEVVVAVDGLFANADREGLTIVFRNLLGNALKFSRESHPPRIEVGGTSENGTCVVWVRDNGIGFDMAYHDRIFEIFQRLHRVESFAGTGIGLALVRKAVERMKGRTWAESAPGAGATFFVELPG